jgi:predicted thioesterase
LPAGWATVGSEINTRRLAPAPVGRTVATARFIEVAGRSVLFAVEAHDGVRKVGEEGTHHRGALHLERFLKRAGS